MKNFTITLVFITFALFCNAQKLTTYLPSGEVYKGASNTMKKLNNELAPGIPVYIHSTVIDGKMAFIGYMLFSDHYYWMMLESPEIKEKALKSYNWLEFIESEKLFTELKIAIDKKNLSDIHLLRTLGEPRTKTSSYSSNQKIELWTYKGFKMRLTLINGIVTNYIRFDN